MLLIGYTHVHVLCIRNIISMFITESIMFLMDSTSIRNIIIPFRNIIIPIKNIIFIFIMESKYCFSLILASYVSIDASLLK